LKRYDKLENLLAFDELHRGLWQWWRFGVGLILLGFINLLAFSRLPQLLGDAAGGMPAEVVLALSVLSFILLMEGWIWFRRIQAHHYHRLIGKLSQKYDLSPKTPLSLMPSTPAPVVVQTTPAPR
jgi:hypothetical protein